MAIAPYAEPITVCTYGFNVPCRRFLISANVTRDRRLPVVDEFVLRTLKLCESVPVKRLGAYFGFSNSETDAVVGDLVNRGLVVLTAMPRLCIHRRSRCFEAPMTGCRGSRRLILGLIGSGSTLSAAT